MVNLSNIEKTITIELSKEAWEELKSFFKTNSSKEYTAQDDEAIKFLEYLNSKYRVDTSNEILEINTDITTEVIFIKN